MSTKEYEDPMWAVRGGVAFLMCFSASLGGLLMFLFTLVGALKHNRKLQLHKSCLFAKFPVFKVALDSWNLYLQLMASFFTFLYALVIIFMGLETMRSQDVNDNARCNVLIKIGTVFFSGQVLCMAYILLLKIKLVQGYDAESNFINRMYKLIRLGLIGATVTLPVLAAVVVEGGRGSAYPLLSKYACGAIQTRNEVLRYGATMGLIAETGFNLTMITMFVNQLIRLSKIRIGHTGKLGEERSQMYLNLAKRNLAACLVSVIPNGSYFIIVEIANLTNDPVLWVTYMYFSTFPAYGLVISLLIGTWTAWEAPESCCCSCKPRMEQNRKKIPSSADSAPPRPTGNMESASKGEPKERTLSEENPQQASNI